MPPDVLTSLRSEVPTKTLYHYTSPAGLIGIIESKSLWASGIHYLNDIAEYTHASSVVKHVVDRNLERERDPSAVDLYRLILRGVPFYSGEMVFVGSLSEAGDKLSQWRAYCPTGGFSIGFDPKLIQLQAERQQFQLVKCEYDVERQRAICNALVAQGCSAARECERMPEVNPKLRTTSKESLQTLGLWHRFVEPLMRIGPALKNPSFEEEHEWRVIRGPFDEPDHSVRFRAGKYTVIPYREFALADGDDQLDLEEIIVGPNPDPEQAIESVEYLLKVRNVRCKRVRGYAGTYRNWA